MNKKTPQTSKNEDQPEIAADEEFKAFIEHLDSLRAETPGVSRGEALAVILKLKRNPEVFNNAVSSGRIYPILRRFGELVDKNMESSRVNLSANLSEDGTSVNLIQTIQFGEGDLAEVIKNRIGFRFKDINIFIDILTHVRDNRTFDADANKYFCPPKKEKNDADSRDQS